MRPWHGNTVLTAGIALLALCGSAWAAGYAWDFDTEGDVAEWTLSGLINDSVTNGLLTMTATRGNPMLFTPHLNISAADRKTVRFRMKLGKGIPTKGCLLFVTDRQTQYTDEAQVIFDCATDGEFHDYEVDMSEDPLWTGKVLQLRFQPFYVGWPIPEAHRIVVLDRFDIPGSTGLIANGGLEEIDERGYPAGWTKFCESPLPVDEGSLRKSGNPANSLVSDEAFGGQYALHVNIPDGKSEIGGWQTRVPIEPRTMYRLSFRAKRVGEAHAVASINEFGEDGKRTVHHERAVTSAQWQTYSLDLESNAKTVGLQIAPIIWSSAGQVWFDDFSLIEIDLSGESVAVDVDPSPFNLLTRDVVTPHIPWANPCASGPVKILAIPKHREIVELAQRLSLDYTTWSKFEKSDAGEGGYAGLNDLYHGRRTRGLTASYAELAAKLESDYDCVLIGPQRWGPSFSWPGLPGSLKEAMLAKVKLGAGLVYVRPLAETRSDLESRMDRPVEGPVHLAAGVPYEGLTVLDRDMQGGEWLQCFALGAGRVAIVDFPSESFGFWEGERSFRRGMASPFTPDVTYDYRARPLYYEYYQSLLAKLVLWASNREGPVALTAIRFEDGSLHAGIRNAGNAREVAVEVVVRDADDTQEFTFAGTLELAAGDVPFTQPIAGLKAGGHFGDVWVKESGKTLAWGSTFFRTESSVNITKIGTDRSSHRRGGTVRGRLVLDGTPPAGVTARLTLTDSLGRILHRGDLAADSNDIPFEIQPAGTEVCLHSLQATLVQGGVVLSAKTVDVIVRAEPVLDDFKFQFWTPSANNDLPSRYMLNDMYRRGFDVGFLGYLYAQGPEQFRPLIRNTVAANLDVGLFAYSLAAWNAGSDPTITVSPRCLTAPAVRAELFNTLKQHAATAKDFTTYGYGLGDEAGICGHGQDLCFSPTCLEYTRNYLRGRVDSLDALNREWGTSFTAWEDVRPMTREEARQHGNVAPWVDHRMAMEDMFAGLVAECADAIREEDPGVMTGTEGITGDGMYGNGGESSTVGYDFGKIIPSGTFWVIYFQHYPQIEFLRSFAAPGSVLGTYATPFEECPGGYFEDTWQNEQTARFVPWFGLFNGMNGTTYWGSMGTQWHGFYSFDFRPTPWSQHITETMAELKRGIAKLILNCRRDNTGIAIHYSPASLHVQNIMGGRERVESPKAFCKLLEDLGLQYDFLSREQMAVGRLQDYRALILPYSRAISDEEAAAIRRFADGGGVLIADGTPGTMNGHGRRVSGNMLAGVAVHVATNAVWKYNGSDVRDGEAGRLCRAEIAEALETAGVRPRFRIVPREGGDLNGCEVVGFADGSAEYLGILQGREYVRKQDEDHTPVPVTIELPQRFHVYDVRQGRYVGHTDRIETGIEPAVAKLYALLPCRVESISVTGVDDVYESGATVDYAVRSATLPAAGISQVFRVDVSTPEAGVYREYGRTLYACKGEALGAFTLALNDLPGTWTVRVTDVATGTTNEKTFSVLVHPSAAGTPPRRLVRGDRTPEADDSDGAWSDEAREAAATGAYGARTVPASSTPADVDAGKTMLAQFIRLENRGDVEFTELQAYDEGKTNVALRKPVAVSTPVWGDGSVGNDGISSKDNHVMMRTPTGNWWEVDLGKEIPLTRVVIHMRPAAYCEGYRPLDGASFSILDRERNSVASCQMEATASEDMITIPMDREYFYQRNLSSRFRVTSDSPGNIFAREEGLLRLAVPDPKAIASGRATLSDLEGRVLRTIPLSRGTGDYAVPLQEKGYYTVTATVNYEGGLALTKTTTAAVIGEPLDNRTRLESVFGIQGGGRAFIELGAAWSWTGVMTHHVKKSVSGYEWLPAYASRIKNGKLDLSPDVNNFVLLHHLPEFLQSVPASQRGNSPTSPPNDYEEFIRFIKWITSAIPDFVKYVGPIGEPSWSFKGSPEELARYHEVVARTIRELRPDIRVIGPMMSPGNSTALESIEVLDTLGMFAHLDGISINPYVVDWPTPFRSRMPEADFIEFVDAVISYFASTGRPDYPLYLTEFGWYVPGHVDELTRTRYSSRAAILLATRPVIRMVNFFSLSGGGGFSYLNYDGTPRPVYPAMAHTFRWLGGCEDGTTIRLTPTLYLAVFRRNGTGKVAVWDTAEASVLRIPGDAVERVEDMLGRTVRLDTGAITAGPSPVFIDMLDDSLARFCSSSVVPEQTVSPGGSVDMGHVEQFLMPDCFGVRSDAATLVPGTPPGTYRFMGKANGAWHLFRCDVPDPGTTAL